MLSQVRFCNLIQRLDQALTDSIPENVVAFYINLVNQDKIELFGCPQYTPDDDDWPCDFVWKARDNEIQISDYIDDTDDCDQYLDLIRNLIMDYLVLDNPGVTVLRQSQAVAIGYNSGELHTIWKYN